MVFEKPLKGKNRIGIICDESGIYKWQMDVINFLIENGFELSNVLTNNKVHKENSSAYSSIYKWYYNKLMRKLESYQIMDINLINYESFKICPFDAYIAKSFRNSDALINFSSIPGEELAKINLGCGFIEVNLCSNLRKGGLPFIWDFIEDKNTTQISIFYYSPEGGKLEKYLVDSGIFGKTSHSYSHTVKRIFAKLPEFLYSSIMRISVGNDENKIYKENLRQENPNNIQMFKYYFYIAINTIKAINTFRLRKPYWTIGVIDDPIHKFLEKDYKPEISFIKTSKNSFIADPFSVVLKDKKYVFYEKLDYNNRMEPKGIIEVAEYDNSTQFKNARTIMKFDHHLSFPYVFKHEDEYYCVPESNEMNEISLFRATEFPYKWIKEKVLINKFPGVDSIIFRYNGLWWLGSTKRLNPESYYLWYSENPLGEWHSHGLNPVKVDVRCCRNGGTPFYHQGRFYRPVIDVTNNVTWRIHICEVKKLSPTEFEEETIQTINPIKGTPFKDGVHTLSSFGEFTLIDGKVDKLKFWF